jgi:hypothetical protein
LRFMTSLETSSWGDGTQMEGFAGEGLWLLAIQACAALL